MKYVHALTSLRSSAPLTEKVTKFNMNINLNLIERVKCMQKAVNIILTLMSPTPSPPAVLLPWPRHLPHALSHSQLDL